MKTKFLKIVVCALLFAPCVYSQQTSKPNIIFILGDDIGFTIPGVNGGLSFTTPNVDSMARHGINFTHCEASPLCSPSRFMLLTGKYNFRNYSNWGYLSYNEKTFGNLMHDAGYATGFFGKLQLQIANSTMRNWGFDKYTIFEITEDTIEYRHYKNPVLIDNGYRIPDSLTANKYGDDILTQKLFDFIDNNKHRPFFAYYPMALAHGPFSPTPDDSAFANWNTDRRDTAFYPSMIKYMDKKIGEILQWLRSKKLDKNTLVIFCGDNGTSARISFDGGDGGTDGEKGSTAEGGTHVPLIAYWPKHIKAGSVNDDLIDFTDFFTTFAEAAGVSKLKKYGVADGLSFYKRMLNKKDSLKEKLFMHYNQHPGSFTDTLERWVRNKTYKLYDISPSQKSNKFYNIQTDPAELNPLYDSVLTRKEIATKQKFRLVLDTTATWPDAPVVKNPLVTNIKNHSAVITATIISQGASALIERGSTYDDKHYPFLQYNRMIDDAVSTGSFSHTLTKLKPQKKYYYSLYGMNANAANSTSFATDSFYTISDPPTQQAKSFTADVSSSKLILKWKGVEFPEKDATECGYFLTYSKGNPLLSASPNGHTPEEIIIKGKIAFINSVQLPALPVDSIALVDLSPDSSYTFMLIPFTWDGINSSTYNYLTKDALTVTVKIPLFNFASNLPFTKPFNLFERLHVATNTTGFDFVKRK